MSVKQNNNTPLKHKHLNFRSGLSIWSPHRSSSCLPSRTSRCCPRCSGLFLGPMINSTSQQKPTSSLVPSPDPSPNVDLHEFRKFDRSGEEGSVSPAGGPTRFFFGSLPTNPPPPRGIGRKGPGHDPAPPTGPQHQAGPRTEPYSISKPPWTQLR